VPGHKYYTVWKGRTRGVFASWADCEKQVRAFAGAQYKAFATREEALRALSTGYSQFEGQASSQGLWKRAVRKPLIPSICVDAACSGSPGMLEFRGVLTQTGQQVFRAGPFRDGTNNIGEFLAIVEALRWLRKMGSDWPIYSDSSNAIGWIRAGRSNTRLLRTQANTLLFEMIQRAEADLHRPALQSAPFALLKWDTRAWGENPADFGRK
jgi:ribonuclease HI